MEIDDCSRTNGANNERQDRDNRPWEGDGRWVGVGVANIIYFRRAAGTKDSEDRLRSVDKESLKCNEVWMGVRSRCHGRRVVRRCEGVEKETIRHKSLNKFRIVSLSFIRFLVYTITVIV